MLKVLDGRCDPAYNMWRDRQLFERCEDSQIPFIRIYSWQRPALTVGHRQQIKDFNFFGGEVVRRLTGGGGVLHFPGELTYSLGIPLSILAKKQTIIDTCSQISELIIEVLATLGIESTELARERGQRLEDDICFVSKAPYEVVCQGKKLVGSAQKRSRKVLFQHGSIGIPFPILEEGILSLDKKTLFTSNQLFLADISDVEFEQLQKSLFEKFSSSLLKVLS